MGLFDMANRWIRASPWRLIGIVCVTGFLAGGLLDLDHVLEIFGIKIGYVPFQIPGRYHSGRILHGIAFVGGGALCACAGGYLYWNILKDVVVKFKNKVQERLASLSS